MNETHRGNEYNDFIFKADKLKPILYETYVTPDSDVRIIIDNTEKSVNPDELSKSVLKKDDKIYLDFLTHLVGYFSFDIDSLNTPADAPAYLKIRFAEQLNEFREDFRNYNGTLSSSWLQEERIHIDEIPSTYNLPRRYAFRYVEIEILDTSSNYRICLDNISVKCVSSANMNEVIPSVINDKELKEIEKISILTLKECMQDVIEDGPKRDRRLWLGDLRLASLINNYTFKNYDLVKRCLYLFAGLKKDTGRIPACLYTKPKYAAGEVELFDYSLFFVSCLYDLYNANSDKNMVKELWQVATEQIEIAKERLDEKYLVTDSEDWWSFIDWNDNLNKQAASQAIFIYTLRQYISLAKEVEERETIQKAENLLTNLINASMKYLWDDEEKFFVSGKNRQISWASQIWFVLAEVLNPNESKELLKRLKEKKPSIGMVTPYMYHHYVEALFKSGLKEEAIKIIRGYWGEMIKDGANCFYEIFNPDDKNFSPYKSMAINSYCHAWSATPAYLLRKYL